MKIKIFFLVILIGSVVIFSLQNYEVVEIQFLFWQLQASRAIVVLTCLTLGLIGGWTLSSFLRK